MKDDEYKKTHLLEVVVESMYWRLFVTEIPKKYPKNKIDSPCK